MRRGLAFFLVCRGCDAAATPNAGALVVPRENGTLISLLESSSCKCNLPYSPSNLIIYNRVPKCGSTTMLNYIGDAAMRHGFEFESSDLVSRDHWTITKPLQDALVAQLADRANQNGKLVYARHIYYVDFPSSHRARPLYMNLIRNPAAQQASMFYYLQDCICENGSGDEDAWCRDKVGQLKNHEFCTIDFNWCWANLGECTRLGYYPGGRTLVPFFCGQDPVCQRSGAINMSPENVSIALHQARTNLENEYAWVGILEMFTASLVLLKQRLPSFFSDMDATFWANKHFNTQDDHSNRLHKPPTEKTIAYMRQHSSVKEDFDLYDYAKNLLVCRLDACGIEYTNYWSDSEAIAKSSRRKSTDEHSRVSIYQGMHINQRAWGSGGGSRQGGSGSDSARSGSGDSKSNTAAGAAEHGKHAKHAKHHHEGAEEEQ